MTQPIAISDATVEALAKDIHRRLDPRGCNDRGECPDLMARCYCMYDIKEIRNAISAAAPDIIREAVEGEREACAILADEERELARGMIRAAEKDKDMEGRALAVMSANTARDIAAAIRARKEPPP